MDVKMRLELRDIRERIVEEFVADDDRMWPGDISDVTKDQIDRLLEQAFEMGAKHSPSPTTQEASA